MLQKLSDFQQVKAYDLNRVIEAVNATGAIYAAPPLEVTRTAGQVQIRMTERGWTARVTGRTDLGASADPRWQYSVAEVQPDPDEGEGKWRLVAGGRELDSIVYEWNDLKAAVGNVVWVEPFGADDWRFQLYPPPGGFDTGECSNCGWLAEQIDATKSALQLTVPTGLGRCACIDGEQGQGEEEADKFYLVWDSDVMAWAALKPFKTCCGCANLHWTQQPETLSATLTMANNNSCETDEPFSFNFKLECCQTGQTTFVGWGPDACDDEKEPCSNIYRIQLECVPMPTGRVCDCEKCNFCCSMPGASRFIKIPNPGFSDCDAYNLNWYLEHVEGCVWQAGCDNVTVTLQHIDGDPGKWRVTFAGGESGGSGSGGGGGCGTFVYEIPDYDYTCCGNNSFSHEHQDGTPDTITVKRFNIYDPEECNDEPCCEYPDALHVTISPDGCGTFSMTLPAENDPPTSWLKPDFVWGSCCPCWPIETTTVSVSCSELDGFNVSVGSPTTVIVDVVVTVLSASPIHLIATGTLECGGSGIEGGCEPSSHAVTIEVTE